MKEARYARMAEAVNAWKVPDELLGLKEFMLQQLSISRVYSILDGMIDGPKSGAEWRMDRIARARRECSRLIQRREEEAESVKSQNAWLDTFWSSLPAEEPPPSPPAGKRGGKNDGE